METDGEGCESRSSGLREREGETFPGLETRWRAGSSWHADDVRANDGRKMGAYMYMGGRFTLDIASW